MPRRGLTGKGCAQLGREAFSANLAATRALPTQTIAKKLDRRSSAVAASE